MHLTCPSCGATFLVEPEHLGPTGRRVRCGECGHTWRQAWPSEAEAAEQSEAKAAAEPFAPAEPLVEAAPAEPIAAPAAAEPSADWAPVEPLAESTPEPADAGERGPRRAVSKPPRPRRQSSLAAGWLLFCVVVAGLGAGFYFGRAQLVAMVPQMIRLYDLVGLSAASAGLGLELRDVKSVWRLVDGERVVVIEGLVVNVSGETRKVPRLSASLTDAVGVERDRWTFAAADPSLAPGAATGFETVAKNPPRESNLSIDFVLAD
jgi:predicted Zn finger-like uncharacterized protein